ncbi:MAG: ribosome biogenesis GTPase Der [Erysipelotrichaceae bacterium]|nr:ribosome biogenesis GTPase Der [Erysipelotrichaceae bacterium]
MISGIIAIVGRPNVGKSTIFNRILGKRQAIIEDTPGVTRDRLYGKAEWLTKEFQVIDTGGLQIKDQPFQQEIRMQVEIAMEEADAIVFVVNGIEGLTADDRYISSMLHKTSKPVILLVNKIDDISKIDTMYEFYQLGFGDPIAVSGVHGIGIGDALDRIIASLKGNKYREYEGMIKFSIIGQPNVGKSSLVNAILNEERVIVSPIEGTTRDAIDTPFVKDGKEYVVIDTAGIRRKGKIYEKIEKYAVLRAIEAIERSDVILLVLDAEAGIRNQDKHVAGYALDAGKPIIIVYNKWDLVDKDDKTMNAVIEKIRTEFVYLRYAPIAFVSALNKKRINTLIPLIDECHYYSNLRITTSTLNEVVLDAQELTPGPTINGKRVKISYASQVAVAPPTFVLFVNEPKLFHFSYQRYIENRLREAFNFTGTPIRLLARKKSE